jgi:hypothetical protein
VFYPKAFRQRYTAEMRRDFFELLWEGLQEGGRRSSLEWGVGETMLPPMRVSCSPEKSLFQQAVTSLQHHLCGTTC